MVWKRLFLRQIFLRLSQEILLLLKRNFGEFTDANKGRSSLLCYPSYCVAAIWKRILKVFSNTSMVMWKRYGHVHVFVITFGPYLPGFLYGDLS